LTESRNEDLKKILNFVLRHVNDNKLKLEAAQRIRDEGNLDILEAFTEFLEGDWWIRKEVERIFNWFVESKKMDFIIRNLTHGNKYVRTLMAVTLGITKNKRAVEPLVWALNDEDSDVRAAAARALGMIKDPRALKSLKQALSDECWVVRYATVWALGTFRDPKLLETLVEHLKNEGDETVRWELTRSLGKIGEPAVPTLIQLLKDEDWQVREMAALSLGKIKNVRAVEPLITLLEEEPNQPINSCVRRRALWALGEIGDARAVSKIMLFLRHKDPEIRNAAKKALDKIQQASEIVNLKPGIGYTQLTITDWMVHA